MVFNAHTHTQRVQVRNPVFVADCHPDCPTNSFGQPIILEGATAVPWKQVLIMQLVGYRAFEEVQSMFRCVLHTVDIGVIS